MAATQKTIVLITGGNNGIGFEAAAQLLADATKHVIIGSRSVQKGQAALKALQSRNQPGSAEMLELEVTSKVSVVAAAQKVERDHGRLDVLVNNAAIAEMPPGMPLEEQMQKTFVTNCIGPAMMVEAFGPLLKKSAQTARIINVSSAVGSITERSNQKLLIYHIQENHYRASKAHLNMLTACHAYEYGPLGIKVFALDPGFTVSTLNQANTPENGARPTADAAKFYVDTIDGKRDAEHGCFIHDLGQNPW